MSIFTTGLGGNAEYSAGLMPYFLFMGNINTELLDAAFGKNNDDEVKGIGMALAMYAKFKDPNIDFDIDFPSLIQIDKISDINGAALAELLTNHDLFVLCSNSTMASEILYTDSNIVSFLNTLTTTQKETLDEFWSDNSCMVDFYNNYSSLDNILTLTNVRNAIANSTSISSISRRYEEGKAYAIYDSPCLLVELEVTLGEHSNFQLSQDMYGNNLSFGKLTEGYSYDAYALMPSITKVKYGTSAGGATITSKYIPITL